MRRRYASNSASSVASIPQKSGCSPRFRAACSSVNRLCQRLTSVLSWNTRCSCCPSSTMYFAFSSGPSQFRVCMYSSTSPAHCSRNHASRSFAAAHSPFIPTSFMFHLLVQSIPIDLIREFPDLFIEFHHFLPHHVDRHLEDVVLKSVIFRDRIAEPEPLPEILPRGSISVQGEKREHSVDFVRLFHVGYPAFALPGDRRVVQFAQDLRGADVFHADRISRLSRRLERGA